MKQFSLILLFFSISNLFTYYPTEFLYPIDEIVHEDVQKMCVLYQKNNHLELWLWNPVNGEAIKGLLSSFNPSGLAVLPNKKTFSFIDNDRIRIKQINKRSPGAIDLYGPYDLTTIHWIDNHSFYFAAKERQHNNLFHANIDGDLFRLTVSNNNDYTYPSKIDDELFFIEHSAKHGYSIMKAHYPNNIIENKKNKELTLEEVLKEENNEYIQYLDLEAAQKIIMLDDATPAFLCMKDSECGFFIQHPNSVERTDKTMNFSYHTFYKTKDEGWKVEKLFEFTLPLYLLLPQQDKVRLYESILPFLPFHDQDTLYYSNLCLETDSINVFSYNLVSKVSTQRTMLKDQHSLIFPPRTYQNRLFSGGTNNSNFLTTPTIDIDEFGKQCFHFLDLTHNAQQTK